MKEWIYKLFTIETPNIYKINTYVYIESVAFFQGVPQEFTFVKKSSCAEDKMSFVTAYYDKFRMQMVVGYTVVVDGRQGGDMPAYGG